MGGEKIRETRLAVSQAIDLLHPDAWFCVIAGTDTGKVCVPLTQATPENRLSAQKAVRHLGSSGPTAMSTWLRTALAELRKKPDGIHHALLLTGGKDEGGYDANGGGLKTVQAFLPDSCSMPREQLLLFLGVRILISRLHAGSQHREETFGRLRIRAVRRQRKILLQGLRHARGSGQLPVGARGRHFCA